MKTHNDYSQELIRLAQERFGEPLSAADRKLFEAAAEGTVADYSGEAKAKNDPARATGWAEERVLLSDRIAWLCTDRAASALVTHRGIAVQRARIEGALELQWVRCPFPLTFSRCAFTGLIDLSNARLTALQLSGSHAKAVVADGLKVECDVFLNEGFTAEGQVRLLGATIGGDLACDGGTFSNPDGNALSADRLKVGGTVSLAKGFRAEGAVRLPSATIGASLNCGGGTFSNPGGNALIADGLKVGGNVFLQAGFSARGEVRLLGATIGANLECYGGTFSNPDGDALSADRLKVEGGVFLTEGFSAEGQVRLPGVTIGANLECYGGTFSNPDGNALNADGLKVEGGVFLREGFRAEGRVSFTTAMIGKHFQWRGVVEPARATFDLRNATVDTLWDEEESWPSQGNLYLNGLEYEQLAPASPHDVKSRLNWLGLQPEYEPQPYGQLARVLRAGGHEREATRILIAREDARGRQGSMSRWRKIVSWLHGFTLGHGYRPQRAFWRFAPVFLIGGAVLFWHGNKAELFSPARVSPAASDTVRLPVTSQYPRFNPIVYSIDAFVPIINLHQESYWLPDANADPRPDVWWLSGRGLRIYHWFHIGFGWLLSFLFVAGLSGLVRKD